MTTPEAVETAERPTAVIEQITAALALLYALLTASVPFVFGPAHEPPSSALTRLALTFVSVLAGSYCLKGRSWALHLCLLYFGVQSVVVRSPAFNWDPTLGFPYELGFRFLVQGESGAPGYEAAFLGVNFVALPPLILAIIARKLRWERSLLEVDEPSSNPPAAGLAAGALLEEAAESREGQTPETESRSAALDTSAVVAPSIPLPAGLPVRTTAFVGDMGLLAAAQWTLGHAYAALWLAMGPYGKLVGFVSALQYFGWMNSRHGNGQTICMQWLGLAVRDDRNRPIGLMRATLRTAPLQFCIFRAFTVLPHGFFVDYILGGLFWAVGGAVAYTLLFNRRARQGIHDVVSRTYVVHLRKPPIERFPSTAPVHVRVSLGIAGVVALMMSVTAFWLAPKLSHSVVSNLMTRAGSAEEVTRDFWDLHFSDAMVRDLNRGKWIHTLEITVWSKSPVTPNEGWEPIARMVSRMGSLGDLLRHYDAVVITAKYGYDIGLINTFSTSRRRWTRFE